MNFEQLLNSIFGADWLSNVLQIVTGGFALAISAFYAKLKNKYIIAQNDNSKAIGAIEKKLITSNKTVDELKEENEKLQNNVTNLCNIVAMAFLDSKGISSETKLAISGVIGKLQDSGVDLQPMVELTDNINKKADLVVEDVVKIKEDVENTIETAKQNIEGIAEETVELYNKILNEQ